MRDEARKRRGRSAFDVSLHYSSYSGWMIKLLHTFISRVVEFCKETDTFASRHLQKRLCLHRAHSTARNPRWQNVCNELYNGASQQSRSIMTYWCRNDHTVAEISPCPEGTSTRVTWPLAPSVSTRLSSSSQFEYIGERKCQNASQSWLQANFAQSHSELLWDTMTLKLWAFHQNFWKENTPTCNLLDVRVHTLTLYHMGTKSPVQQLRGFLCWSIQG